MGENEVMITLRVMNPSEQESFYKALYHEQTEKIAKKIKETKEILTDWKKTESSWSPDEAWNYVDVEGFLQFLEDLVGPSLSDGRVYSRSGAIPSGNGRTEVCGDGAAQVHREARDVSGAVGGGAHGPG